MNTDVNLVIEDLQRQIASLAKEKAVYYALAVQKEQELKKVKQELEKLKKMKKKEMTNDETHYQLYQS